MSPERVSFQAVFQEIAQSHAPAGEPRAQSVRGGQGPRINGTERVPETLAPQEREERELEPHRPPRALVRPRPAVKPAEPEEGRPPHWAFDSWPFPFASFWTSMAAMALCYPLRSLLVTLAAMGPGIWAGVALDRWLR
ncbi:MAG TPA: hypothetical protein VND93_02660, partial [Myxococcales bacterium]|nr:hypothetical protein [Myxococcales bacterium]